MLRSDLLPTQMLLLCLLWNNAVWMRPNRDSHLEETYGGCRYGNCFDNYEKDGGFVGSTTNNRNSVGMILSRHEKQLDYF
jgi:hypothetical protein